ncbi:MAG: HAMP domain-containing histidine kinase [Patescibacteria group bacterium]|nr:HAMP domain-containing histidine kinase [Patescibacteria group bacterium]
MDLTGSSLAIAEAAVVVIAVAAAVAAMAALIRTLRRGEKARYEFVTIIAHKFRTPLTHIKWAADSLVSDETNPYRKESLQDIRSSNEDLISLTSTLLELTESDRSPLSAYSWEKLDLCAMAESAVEASKRAFHEKNLFIAADHPADSIWVKADRSRLDFVLGVLLDNACRYSPPGRNVEVRVSARGRKAVFSVTDYGIGISPADQSRLFTKFFRADDARAMDTEGFGVALFLARSVVRRHGGAIEAYSDGPGRGSTFSVVLPRMRK